MCGRLTSGRASERQRRQWRRQRGASAAIERRFTKNANDKREPNWLEISETRGTRNERRQRRTWAHVAAPAAATSMAAAALATSARSRSTTPKLRASTPPHCLQARARALNRRRLPVRRKIETVAKDARALFLYNVAVVASSQRATAAACARSLDQRERRFVDIARAPIVQQPMRTKKTTRRYCSKATSRSSDGGGGGGDSGGGGGDGSVTARARTFMRPNNSDGADNLSDQVKAPPQSPSPPLSLLQP